MSILSAPSNRPETVRSLVGLLREHDGSLPRDEVLHWLLPPTDPEKAVKQDQAKSAIAAATSIGLVDGEDPLRLAIADAPVSAAGFADWMHARLVGLSRDHIDRVILEVYAWFVVSCDMNHGSRWLDDLTNEELADRIGSQLPRKERLALKEMPFNSTKLPCWKRWIVYLGLGYEAGSVMNFFPHLAARLELELRAIGQTLGYGKQLDAEAVIDTVATRLPYVDRGALFQEQASGLGHAIQPRRLSLLLSDALRELHLTGSIELRIAGDTTGGALALAPDRFNPKLEHFKFLTIHARNGGRL